MTMRLSVLLLLCFLNLIASGHAGTLDAITFATEPGKLFIPVNEAVDELGWKHRMALKDASRPADASGNVVRK